MKAGIFHYERPVSISEALAAKRKWGATGRFLAGGQSLLPAVNFRLDSSACLIDLGRIEELREIKRSGPHVVIGAMATHAEVIESTLVRDAIPLLRMAGKHLAHAAIRNRGTFGGSLALADPAAEWPAACLLLDAEMQIAGDHGKWCCSASDFLRGLYSTRLGENDLLESVLIPVPSEDERFAVLELARRRGDFAVAAVMARAVVDANHLKSLSVVLFGVSDKPLRLAAVESKALEFTNAGRIDEIPRAICELLGSEYLVADLVHSVEAKRHLCGVLVLRAIRQLMSA
jgi:carbon-monoxide dehydrogenase medium subunit